MAHLEVYILNYNGKRFLSDCLESLTLLEVDEHTINVNVVDNGSCDDSKDFVNSKFPQFNFIDLKSNYGFSGGNNRGVHTRRKELKQKGIVPDFHVFLNNDTIVDKNWAVNALNAFKKYEGTQHRVGIVGSKSVFFDKFFVFDLIIEPGFSPADYGSADTRNLGIMLEGGLNGENIYTDFKRSKIINGYSEENNCRWISPKTRFYVAVKDKNESISINMKLVNGHIAKIEQTFKIVDVATKKIFKTGKITAEAPFVLNLSVLPSNFVDVIQNAGTFVKENWQAGDRGFLEVDEGQYENQYFADSICGVSLFIKDSLFTKLGGYDENYFAYFEDTDLSLRARIEGYKCVYTPDSKIRHIHCGSGGEYSEYFNINVAYSHLIFSSKLMNRKQWKMKKDEFLSYVKNEYKNFWLDESLDGKPNLRAYFRYIKRYPKFLKNRFYSILKKPSKTLLSLNSYEHG